tara:strand:- start:1513 stop:2160 length:648 start_codon:yes stop_codon:yes gene_type:complete
MIELERCEKLFIDFDGVIVDSNNFKELAIKKSVFEVMGENKMSIEAINYFNINAGVSRFKKLSLFYNDEIVKKILSSYSEQCSLFFVEAPPTKGFKSFLQYLSKHQNHIKIFILSGGEKKEIYLFLKKNNLLQYFEEILASPKSKIDHLNEKKVCKNDIFIGDSKTDLHSSIKTGLKFILFEGFKSKLSFPHDELIINNVFLKTNNFSSFLERLI